MKTMKNEENEDNGYYVVREMESGNWIYTSKDDEIYGPLGACAETIGQTADRVGLGYEAFWTEGYHQPDDGRKEGGDYDLSDLPYTENYLYADKSGDTPLVITLDLLSNGDYGGSGAIGVANRRCMEEIAEAEGLCLETHNGVYGHEYLPMPYDLICPEISEAIEGLADYSCIDDEAVSEVEQEWIESALPDTLHDLENGLENNLPVTLEDRQDLTELLYALAERSNTYWVCKYKSPAYLDVGRLVEACTYADLDDHKIKYTLEIGPEDYDIVADTAPPARGGLTAYHAYIVDLATACNLDTTVPMTELAPTVENLLWDLGYPQDTLTVYKDAL